MTDSIQSPPAVIAHHMGWDFNSNTSLEALAAWEAYLLLPVNYGPPVSADAQDAFTAGFDAARSTQSVAAAINALAATQTTANRIAWATRPGHRPWAALSETIDKELGL